MEEGREKKGRGPYGRADLKVVKLPERRKTPEYIRSFLLKLEAYELKKEIFIRMPADGLDRLIAARIKGKVYLLLRMVECGRECSGCPHGPYWYGYYRHKGMFVSFYVGKDLPNRFREARKIQIKEGEGGG